MNEELDVAGALDTIEGRVGPSDETMREAVQTAFDHIAAQAAEIIRLRALLPQTADGVLVADCEAVYCPDCGTQMRLNSDGRHAACFGCRPSGASRYLNLSECLSKPKGSE